MIDKILKLLKNKKLVELNLKFTIDKDDDLCSYNLKQAVTSDNQEFKDFVSNKADEINQIIVELIDAAQNEKGLK